MNSQNILATSTGKKYSLVRMKQGIPEKYGIYTSLDEAIKRFSLESPKYYTILKPDADEIYIIFNRIIIECINKDKIFHENEGIVTTGDFCDEFIIRCI